MGDLEPGARVRLGLGWVKGELAKDDWTGLELRLLERLDSVELWRCERLAGGTEGMRWPERFVVSEERLRAAAWLGKDEDGD